ncbi:MAG: three-Cys-motif partner protein TcmP [Chloroflexi bacterium]|nr:three-Cys-motif partner protein TcmP [Chloroflexota bacterium]
MANLSPRDTQTIVKHEILESYLTRWGNIIINGLRGPYLKARNRGGSFRVRFVYVDCFAHKGRYSAGRNTRDIVPGSPLIGISELEKVSESARTTAGFTPEVFAILIEKDKSIYQDLLDTLEWAGLANRIRETSDFSTLRSGEIATVCGDYRDFAADLLTFTSAPYTWSFYLLDPYGPLGIPLDVVARIVGQDRADVMINFPYQDLHKKTGSVVRGTQEHGLHLQYYDELYGDRNWRNIATDYLDTPDEMETRLVQEYIRSLQSTDESLAIKLVPLKFPDKERTMFYLFLTTHDPTGGLAMNEILDDAKLREHNLRIQWKDEKFQESSGGVLPQVMPGFGDHMGLVPNVPARPSKDVIADHIYELCRGEVIEYREVLRRLVNETYHHDEIRSAMSLLKRQKRAQYTELRNPEIVSFTP